MNMRFSNAFETLPARIQDVPRRIHLLSPRTRLIGAGALAVLAAGALYLIFAAGGQKERVRPLPLVVTTKVVAKNVTVEKHAIGTVVADSTVQVTAQVTGQLLRTGFQEGQIVHKGDLLFVIDPRPFQAALEQAKAQLARDTAQLVNAQSTKQRYDTLFAQNAISSQQRDQADATAKSMAATVTADRAAVQVSQLDLGYTQIRSPITGKTGPILIHPGNLVSANSSNPLVVLTQIEPVKVSFSLPQTDLPRIQERARSKSLIAILDTHEGSAAQLRAPVDFVGSQVSAQTGTIELRASFDNRDHRLVPGQLVDVSVTLDTLNNAAIVPREAVNEGPSGRYVFVVTPDRIAEMRLVDVLYDDGTNMAVKGRLRRGDIVIRDGQFGVTPGNKVKIEHKPANSTANEAAQAR